MQANQQTTKSTQPKSVSVVTEKNKQPMSKDDVKFIGELGWLSAAAVLIAGVAASV